MNNRLKVIYLPHPVLKDPWERDIVQAIGEEHDLFFYDSQLPLSRQFEAVKVVIDFGGVMGTKQMADAANGVRLWQILGNGFDSFDLDYWKLKKIPVANCPGQFSAVPLAECAMMFMLMLTRGWHHTQRSLSSGILYRPLGMELEGRRLLVIGFGASARELVVRARAFGMRVAAMDVRSISAEEQLEFGLDGVFQPGELDNVIGDFDFVSLHLPLNEETHSIIDAHRLRLMKPTAYLINVARAGLVDEEALSAALAEGRLAGAGLDVLANEPKDPNHPILKLSNLVATPHISGTTSGTSRRRAACAKENVERIAVGLEPLYRIA